jgi:hypothetical protein
MDEIFKCDFTLEYADTGHVERHPFSFEMQENRIAPGKAVSLLLVLHVSSPIS